MRKLAIISFAVLLFLSGCSDTKSEDKESMKKYESYIDDVTNNQGIESKIIPFNYNLNVYKQKDDTYQYELVISDPRTAMYSVQAIAVNPEVDSNTNIHPCLGLLGEDAKQKFNLVPFQSNLEKNFFKGIYLEGVSEKSQFTLNVMVTWKDASLTKDNRVYFNANFALEADDTANGAKTGSENENNE